MHLCLSTFLLSYFLTYMRAHLLSLSYRGHVCRGYKLRPLPEPEAGPAPRRISVQARPHRLRSKRDATRLPGAAGRCGAVVLGHRRARWPSAERRARAAQAARVVGAAPPPMTPQHEAAGAVVRPARRSTVRGARTPPERGRCVAHWRSDGTRAPQTGAAARESVLLVCLRGGGDARKGRFVPPSPPGTMLSTLKAQRDDPIPPNPPGTRVLDRCTSVLGGYHPS